jgi:hypothetical protein
LTLAWICFKKKIEENWLLITFPFSFIREGCWKD